MAIGLLVRATAEAVTWIPAGCSEPTTEPTEAFAQRYTGQLVQLKRQAEAANDADQASTQGAFGFGWFFPELLKHKKVWRDVLSASLVLQLLALGLPLFTQVIIDKVLVHQTESTLIAVAIGMGLFKCQSNP